jgi:hypothetical protein
MAVPYLLGFGWEQRYEIKNASHKKMVLVGGGFQEAGGEAVPGAEGNAGPEAGVG